MTALSLAACSPYPRMCKHFAASQADTLHIFSTPERSSSPEFQDNLTEDSALCKWVGLPVAMFKPAWRVRIDGNHQLVFTETYTGINGTTFHSHVARRGVDSLRFQGQLCPGALYADEPVSDVGDHFEHEEADELWVLDLDGDGDKDCVFSAWSWECVAVVNANFPETLEPDCKENIARVRCYYWNGNAFEEGECKNPEAFIALRHRQPEGK